MDVLRCESLVYFFSPRSATLAAVKRPHFLSIRRGESQRRKIFFTFIVYREQMRCFHSSLVSVGCVYDCQRLRHPSPPLARGTDYTRSSYFGRLLKLQASGRREGNLKLFKVCTEGRKKGQQRPSQPAQEGPKNDNTRRRSVIILFSFMCVQPYFLLQ